MAPIANNPITCSDFNILRLNVLFRLEFEALVSSDEAISLRTAVLDNYIFSSVLLCNFKISRFPPYITSCRQLLAVHIPIWIINMYCIQFINVV